jgi:proteasome alpha subunit
MKPYEVELLVGQVGEGGDGSEQYHVLFDGSVTDEHGFVAMGGRAEELTEELRSGFGEAMALGDAIRLATSALASVEEEQPLEPGNVEAAVLDRTRGRRKFRRLSDPELLGILHP